MITELSKIRVVRGEGKASMGTEGIIADCKFCGSNIAVRQAGIIITRLGKKGKPRLSYEIHQIVYYSEDEIKKMFPLQEEQKVAVEHLQSMKGIVVETLDLKKTVLKLSNLEFLAYVAAKSVKIADMLNKWGTPINRDYYTDLTMTQAPDEALVKNGALNIFNKYPSKIMELVTDCSFRDHTKYKQHGFHMGILEQLVSGPDMRGCIMATLYSWEAAHAKALNKHNMRNYELHRNDFDKFTQYIMTQANKSVSNEGERISAEYIGGVISNGDWPRISAEPEIPINYGTRLRRHALLPPQNELRSITVPGDRMYKVWESSFLEVDVSYRYPDITLVVDPRNLDPTKAAIKYIIEWIIGRDIEMEDIILAGRSGVHEKVFCVPGIIRIVLHYHHTLAQNPDRYPDRSRHIRYINNLAAQEQPVPEPVLAEPVAEPTVNVEIANNPCNEVPLIHKHLIITTSGNAYILRKSNEFPENRAWAFPDMSVRKSRDESDNIDDLSPPIPRLPWYTFITYEALQKDLLEIIKDLIHIDAAPETIQCFFMGNKKIYSATGLIRLIMEA